MEEKVEHLSLSSLIKTPCLLYTHESNNHVQIFHSISGPSVEDDNNRSCVKSIPQLRGKSILGRFYNEWLFLRDELSNEANFSIFNLFTCNTINLPPLQAAPRSKLFQVKCTLKSPPDCDDCVLMLCFYLSEMCPSFMYSCRPAHPNCTWVSLRPFGYSDVFVYNKVMYVSAKCSSRIFTEILFREIDDVTNTLIFEQSRIPKLNLEVLGLVYPVEYLIESCQRLYHISLHSICAFDSEVTEVKVFELDLDGKNWRQINSLDGRAFFLGPSCCTWCWGRTNAPKSGGGIQGNCIYFCHQSIKDQQFYTYMYNLLDNSFMTLRPCSSSIRPSSHPVWLIPRNQRLSTEKELKKNEDPELSHHQMIQHESRVSNLPLHLIELISKHMHLFDYWNFRASCTSFRSVCPPRQWRSHTNNAVFPMDMLFTSKGGSWGLTDPCRGTSYSSTLQLFPHPFTLFYSKNGWLLTYSNQRSFQFINLITGEKQDLTRGHFGYSIGFSTDPTYPNCLSVGINNTDSQVRIYYHITKYKNWHRREFDCAQFGTVISTPIFLDGAVYFLDEQGHLGVFRLIDGEPDSQWDVYGKPLTFQSRVYSFYLLECLGDLYSVFIEKMGSWVRVFRFDNMAKIWVEVDSLQRHCFFISRVSSFSILSRDHTIRNRIYLPRLRRNGIVFYSLVTRKYHVSGYDDFMEDLYDTTEPSSCCWM